MSAQIWSKVALGAVAASLLVGCVAQEVRSAGDPTTPAMINPGALPFVRQADERFQSFQIGFSHLTGGETWKSYDDLPKDGSHLAAGFQAVREARQPKDLSNPRLRALTAALAPLYIRYSGTTANSVYFQDNDEPAAKPPEGFTVVLTRKSWKGAIDFAKAVDAKVLTSFANSEGVRDAEHAWTPRMAAPWLAYTKSIGGEIYAAELFNEPNAPEPPRVPRGHTAEEFGRDFAAFRTFLAPVAPAIKVAGPGTAMMGVGGIPSIETYTPEMYASATPKPNFDIYSYHYYPALAERCAPVGSPQGVTVDQALTAAWFARPDVQFQRQKAVRDSAAPGAPIWLTETGGAACGGLRWQPAFLDMFRYLDTQGRLIKQGLDAMFTHALISGSNGIIDEKTYEPNASYWGAVLWSRLMGNRVLDAGAQRPGLNLYAHCQRGVRGGVTMLAINYGEAATELPITGRAQLYLLTGPELQGRTVLLNGQPLSVGADNRLPAMDPQQVGNGRVNLPGRSIGFITLSAANNRACRS